MKYALFLVVFLLASCGHAPIPGNVKVYRLQEQGLVRLQVKETLPFAKAKGYLCESPGDFESTVGCVGGGVKVWYLDPARGLVRKQQGQTLSFQNARGYFCVSPADMKYILDKCINKKSE